MNMFLEIISYPFMIRAIIVGCLVTLCASLLGVSLVLRRFSMIGDGLSHIGFGALALACVLNLSPLKVTIPIIIIAAFFLLKITQNSKIKADSAIALISTGALSIGVIIISCSSGMNTDLNSYLFGSILAMSNEDMILSIILSIIVLTLFIVFYNKIFLVTFDEQFAKASGINIEAYNALIAILTSLIIVIGMRMMGSMLISALIIFPALTSMRLFKTFRSVTISSSIISVFCFIIGMIFSYALSLPTGATIVCVNIISFFVFWIIAKIKYRVK